jgi:hypothetical protein
VPDHHDPAAVRPRLVRQRVQRAGGPGQLALDRGHVTGVAGRVAGPREALLRQQRDHPARRQPDRLGDELGPVAVHRPRVVPVQEEHGRCALPADLPAGQDEVRRDVRQVAGRHRDVADDDVAGPDGGRHGGRLGGEHRDSSSGRKVFVRSRSV